eukprot:112459-Amphidinium_carterae.1
MELALCCQCRSNVARYYCCCNGDVFWSRKARRRNRLHPTVCALGFNKKHMFYSGWTCLVTQSLETPLYIVVIPLQLELARFRVPTTSF